LALKSEDSLFDVLLEYVSAHPDSFSLFEFVHFKSLSLCRLRRFFDIFPLSTISSNLWNSLSSLSSESPQNPHRCRRPFASVDYTIDGSGTNGLFSSFRSQCSNANPHGKLLEVTASSDKQHQYIAPNVLDWNSPTPWVADDYKCRGEWIKFDLLKQSFIITALSIRTWFDAFAKVWSLQGSDDGEYWTDVYESDTDQRLNTPLSHCFVVFDIENSTAFRQYRILSKSERFSPEPNFDFGILAVEFYGKLIFAE
jgi:hypothetical protein